MKRVLVLGAGLVVKPLLDDLLRLPDVEIHLAALNVERARALVQGREAATALPLDATRQEELVPEVAAADVVVSLLPAEQHVVVARASVEHRVPLVTTSYVSEEMRALDGPARERGVLLLNETGLDPGIDHMTAAEVIRRVQREGGKVVSFSSYCGGLPAPEANTNPWGYKFTWSPRGVVLAARSPVRFIEDGRVIVREFPDLFDAPRRLSVPGVGILEAYPTRDCLRYREAYGLEDGVRDLFRGTLRYPGWCETWNALFLLGLADLEPRDWDGLTYAQFLERHLPPGPGGLVARLALRLAVSQDHPIVSRLEWLGLLSDRPLPLRHASPLDILTHRLQEKLSFQPGERDMVILEHHFVLRRSDGQASHLTKRLLVFGEAGDDSAMARTVSLPAALAVRLLLDGRVELTGVHIPVDPQLTEPILLGLQQRGLQAEETEELLSGSAP